MELTALRWSDERVLRLHGDAQLRSRAVTRIHRLETHPQTTRRSDRQVRLFRDVDDAFARCDVEV